MTDAAALVAGLDLDAQRWFAGKGRTETARRVVDAWPVGPGQLVAFEVAYAEGAPELYVVPVIDDGGLREAGPGDGVFAALAGGGEERTLGVDQTHTSVIVGDRVVKLYRRVERGPNPEVELLEALAAAGFDGVPALRGAVHRALPDGGAVDVAIAQDLVPGAPDGWESLIAPLERLIEGEGGLDDLVPELARCGDVAGRLHVALADAFGLRPAEDDERETWRDAARADLDEALRILPHPLAAELHGDATRIRTGLEALTSGPAPAVTRIHGDLHVAQLLRTPAGVYAIDFEGDPTLTLAERRRPASPLHDLACLLRSLDHVARSAQVRAGLGEPVMDLWIPVAQRAVLDAYRAAVSGTGLEPDPALLRAFCLAKELREFVYAARVLPEWLYAPQLGMRWLMRDDAAL